MFKAPANETGMEQMKMNAGLVAGLVALMWLLELINVLSNQALNANFGLQPRKFRYSTPHCAAWLETTTSPIPSTISWGLNQCKFDLGGKSWVE